MDSDSDDDCERVRGLSLRSLPLQCSAEGASALSSCAPGDMCSDARREREHLSQRTSSIAAVAAVRPELRTGAGNLARGLGHGARMLGRERLPAGWIEEAVPNHPTKLRWWRDAAHQTSNSKPLRAWPAVLAELRLLPGWTEPTDAASAEQPAAAAAAPEAAPDAAATALAAEGRAAIERAQLAKDRSAKYRQDQKCLEAVTMKDVGHEVFLMEKRQLVHLMCVQVPQTCKCKTRNCQGTFQFLKSSTDGHGGSCTMWFRCSGCKRQITFHRSSKVSISRVYGDLGSGKRSVEAVGFMEAVLQLMSGRLYHEYHKSIIMRGARPYGETWFRDIIIWLYPYVEKVLEHQMELEHQRMQELSAADLGSWKRAVSSYNG